MAVREYKFKLGADIDDLERQFSAAESRAKRLEKAMQEAVGDMQFKGPAFDDPSGAVREWGGQAGRALQQALNAMQRQASDASKQMDLFGGGGAPALPTYGGTPRPAPSAAGGAGAAAGGTGSGAGAGGGAAVDPSVLASQQRFLQSLRDQAETFGRTTEEALAYRAAQMGLSAEAAPLISRLQQARAAVEEKAAAERRSAEAARAAAQAQREQASASAAQARAGQQFVESLREQVATQHMSTEELLRHRAAQLGVAQQADALIGKLNATGRAGAISAGQTAAAWRQLPMQMQDIGVSLAGGMNPLLVMIQQVPQITGAFGGVRPAIAALAGAVTPVVAAIGALTIGVTGVAAAFIMGQREAASFVNSLNMTGNAAGLTLDKWDQLTEKISGATGATVGLARESVAVAAGTGLFDRNSIESVSTAIAAYAKVTDQTAEQAGQNFNDIGRDAAAWAVKQNESLHFLTLETYNHIKALRDQGEGQKAAAVAADALTQALTAQPKQLGDIESALAAASSGWSRFWAAAKSIGAPETVGSNLAVIGQQIDSIESKKKLFGGALWVNGGAGDRELAGLKDQQAALQEKERLEKRSAQLQSETAERNQRAIAAQQKIDGIRKSTQKPVKWGGVLDDYMVQVKAMEKAGNAIDALQQKKDIAAIKEKYAEKPASGGASGMSGARREASNRIEMERALAAQQAVQAEQQARLIAASEGVRYRLGMQSATEYHARLAELDQSAIERERTKISAEIAAEKSRPKLGPGDEEKRAAKVIELETKLIEVEKKRADLAQRNGEARAGLDRADQAARAAEGTAALQRAGERSSQLYEAGLIDYAAYVRRQGELQQIELQQQIDTLQSDEELESRKAALTEADALRQAAALRSLQSRRAILEAQRDNAPQGADGGPVSTQAVQGALQLGQSMRDQVRSINLEMIEDDRQRAAAALEIERKLMAEKIGVLQAGSAERVALEAQAAALIAAKQSQLDRQREQATDPLAGARVATRDYLRTIGDAGTATQQAINGGFQQLEGKLSEGLAKGKINLSGFGDFVASEVMKIAIVRPAMEQVAQGVDGVVKSAKDAGGLGPFLQNIFSGGPKATAGAAANVSVGGAAAIPSVVLGDQASKAAEALGGTATAAAGAASATGAVSTAMSAAQTAQTAATSVASTASASDQTAALAVQGLAQAATAAASALGQIAVSSTGGAATGSAVSGLGGLFGTIFGAGKSAPSGVTNTGSWGADYSAMTVPSAAGGFDIPRGKNPLTQLHEEEMVLPAQHANTIRQLGRAMESGGGSAGGGRGGGGGTVVNIITQPGVEASQSSRTGPGGEEIIDVIVRRVKSELADDVSNGGDMQSAMAGRFGLSRARGAVSYG